MNRGTNHEQDGAVFNLVSMKRFMERDGLVKFMVNDLVSKGHDETFALEVVFNSEILGDSAMEDSYNGKGWLTAGTYLQQS